MKKKIRIVPSIIETPMQMLSNECVMIGAKISKNGHYSMSMYPERKTLKYTKKKLYILTHFHHIATLDRSKKMKDKEKGMMTLQKISHMAIEKILFQGHTVVGFVLKRKKKGRLSIYLGYGSSCPQCASQWKLLDGCDNAKRSANNDDNDDHKMQSMFLLLISQLFQYIGLVFCVPQYLGAKAVGVCGREQMLLRIYYKKQQGRANR
ncbi:hypothetical protein RFI_28696 [Reticulomyxa filosa]|uniref:Uncharacterized protein n=1 Tax=Reticulomyxa filosa TaxID=46433 RepID=X6M4X5_RETFI|nr:hypothetical protein RFI_28696 [Reticulomyxa filosa]|eukprot:ETO08691.1 hypothetical protein RFI_28696 [Reticulomyxa filosa]